MKNALYVLGLLVIATVVGGGAVYAYDPGYFDYLFVTNDAQIDGQLTVGFTSASAEGITMGENPFGDDGGWMEFGSTGQGYLLGGPNSAAVGDYGIGLLSYGTVACGSTMGGLFIGDWNDPSSTGTWPGVSLGVLKNTGNLLDNADNQGIRGLFNATSTAGEGEGEGEGEMVDFNNQATMEAMDTTATVAASITVSSAGPHTGEADGTGDIKIWNHAAGSWIELTPDGNIVFHASN